MYITQLKKTTAKDTLYVVMMLLQQNKAKGKAICNLLFCMVIQAAPCEHWNLTEAPTSSMCVSAMAFFTECVGDFLSTSETRVKGD